jgi:hypothetical protein
MKLIELNSYLLFILSIFTPDNIAMASGIMSITLSFTGIVINILKHKNNKKQ